MRFHFWYPIFVRMISSWILDIFCILHFSCDSFYSVLLFVYLAKPKNTIYRLEWKQNEREKAKDCIACQWTIDKIGIERKYKKNRIHILLSPFPFVQLFFVVAKILEKTACGRTATATRLTIMRTNERTTRKKLRCTKWNGINQINEQRKRRERNNMKWSRSECRNYCSIEHCCDITKIGCSKKSRHYHHHHVVTNQKQQKKLAFPRWTDRSSIRVRNFPNCNFSYGFLVIQAPYT